MLGGGWPETLCIIGAWPGVGKSAFIASMLRRMGKASVPVLLFSLEDAASWLIWRYLAYETGVAQVQLRQPGLSQEARRAAQQGFSDIGQYGKSIWIDDRCPLSDKDIERSAKRAIEEHGIRCIVVDHVGEMRSSVQRRDRHDLELQEGLSTLRALAKSYHIPVVCATQLTRQHDRETPRLSDFANSAAIERTARVALALTRKPKDDVLKIWVMKATNSPSGHVLEVPFVAHAAMLQDRHGMKAID